MYKTVIIEDDLLTRETLKDIFELHFKRYEIVALCGTVAEALELLPQQRVDLVLLDMQLPDGQGFDVLKKLAEIDFELIIATMHNSFMLEAIKHSALDYLLKPIHQKDLASALERFENKVEKLEKLRTKNTPERPARLVIPSQDGLELIEIKDLVRLKSDGAYTKLFLSDGREHLTSKNLGFYEDKLKAHNFFRVHHQNIISLSHVKNYIRGEGGAVTMSDNSMVDVSRRKKEEFLNKLAF
jgi:two-component system LytT family response regulator